MFPLYYLDEIQTTQKETFSHKIDNFPLVSKHPKSADAFFFLIMSDDDIYFKTISLSF